MSSRESSRQQRVVNRRVVESRTTTGSGRHVRQQQTRVQQSPGIVRAISPRWLGGGSVSNADDVESEAEAMVGLNDRLATFIDQVKRLEREKNQLEVHVASIEEEHIAEVAEIREMYERKLAKERGLRVGAEEESARLRIEFNKYKMEIDELRPRNKSLEKDLNSCTRRSAQLEAQLAERDARMRPLEEEFRQLKKELEKREKQLNDARKEADGLRITVANLEARILSLQEDVSIERNVNQTIQKSQHSFANTSDIADPEISILQELIEARGTGNTEIEWTELNMLAEQLHSMPLDEFASELRRLKVQISVKEQNDELISRIMELERQLRMEREANLEAVTAREKELRELRASVAKHIRDYQDLLVVKLSLDKEIATYRVLLEGGEARLKISSPETSPRSPSPSRKRRRMVEEEAQVVRSSTTNGFVTIVESDTLGNFVKLHNPMDTDQDMGGWHLTRMADGSQVKFKFKKTFSLPAGGNVTVWSSDSSGKVDNAPSDLVCRKASWGCGNDMQTTLEDKDGEVIATFTEKKEGTNHGNDDHRSSCNIM